MDLTVSNPQQGRLKTTSVELTAVNTTWFGYCEKTDAIAMITDHGRDHPTRIYDASRSQLNHDRFQAKALLRQIMRG